MMLILKRLQQAILKLLNKRRVDLTLEIGRVYPHILDLLAKVLFAKLLLSLKCSLKQQVHRLSDVLSGQIAH